MTKTKTAAAALSAHEQAVSAIVAVGTNKAEAVKAGKLIADAMSALFAEVNGDDSAFVHEFGNGENPKSKTYQSGRLAAEVLAKIKHIKDANKVDSIKNVLKVRLSEARALRKAGGMPQAGENLQAALKRYKKADPAKQADKAAPKGEGEAMTLEEFAKTASMDQVADLVSMWVANHTSAARGIATALADTLPITVKRSAAKAV